jgi:UDP:flavonoid glycosyltransferase YjiC (YdhE family)
VVFFSSLAVGHFNRVRPLISSLSRRGLEAHVLTAGRFREAAERAGARGFIDLFSRYPLEAADDESLPRPVRYVSFAGHYGEAILEDVDAIRPSLVVYDTFAPIGRLVGESLGIPYVNVCAGHNISPPRVNTIATTWPRVHVSEQCHRAVETLRVEHGLPDASPFSFVDWVSPYLNVYCEPPGYLDDADREAFEPVEFYGSLPPADELTRSTAERGPYLFDSAPGTTNVYVSLGTIVWRYFRAEGLEALATLSRGLAGMRDVSAVISLGGAGFGERTVRELSHPNVRVEDYVDQWRILDEADLFVTHHGLNSTHEAIYKGVPMVSHPFFWDQPELAKRCLERGIAVPLTDVPRGQFSEEDVRAVLDRARRENGSIHSRLADAREEELRVVADRERVLDRIIGLIPR